MLYEEYVCDPEDEDEDDDVDDSTNPGSADPWSDDNDGNGTNSDGGIWPND
jgi:hypothetical protein